ncbi:hypothetical protein ACFPYJ_20985 [Paenibacillus solisilvae]|uniref:Secreted protein n=1 Tax=Paenibacillus solisilvae TaxID=2486751 RepID=A0ABW0W3K7_9BACL
MSIKKTIQTALIGICLFSFSQSAFADYDGGGDSPTYAKPFNRGEFASGYIDDRYDVDWFKWTNDTGITQTVNVYLSTPYWENYDIIAVYKLRDGSYLTSQDIDRGSKGNLDHYKFYYISPGYTIYWKIVPHTRNDFSTTNKYFTWFTLS